MGLDMYLEGNIYISEWDGNGPRKRPTRKGYERKGETYDIGYWRKQPDLHGYIIRNFADGIDECQKIELDVDNLNAIKQALVEGDLGETTVGFFFGGHDYGEEERDRSVQIMDNAIKFLSDFSGQGFYASIYYGASW